MHTSDGAPRLNAMTAAQWLDRVLYSGQITKVAQHLALVVIALAIRQEKNGISASLRDLEKITGWGRSTLKDHLAELDGFIHVTISQGRSKSMFELQGMIEHAIGAALVSAIDLRQPDTTSIVASQPDAMPDANPDTSFVSAVEGRQPDTNVCGQPAGHKNAVKVASQPDTTKESFPPYPPSKKNPSIEREEKGERVFAPAPASLKRNPSPHMNGVGFVISEQHGLIIPLEVIAGWRDRFKSLPDIEAAMQRLAATLLHRGITHPGWTCPDGWMAGVLAEMNEEAASKRRVADAKIAGRSKPFKPSRW